MTPAFETVGRSITIHFGPVRSAGASRGRGGRWVRRFVVVDRSMSPALREGQGLLSVRSRRAKVGQLRVLEHPLRPGFWLV